ncbi:ly6/PLAUR domain-containing protein 8-like [Psammomys obesus]|uniref:ly6/PLAUR domain-containing protein 8-like n=1 Tax=Psammomys obesus TaxID=48139 RepID=UPI0024530965|nr:ly6/PLAUR domain-containing protein 8-like [Psammomys obesus]XP_055458851.1 ly6/PLAUR domain-containing protein 8-like [Psammomys obesus]
MKGTLIAAIIAAFAITAVDSLDCVQCHVSNNTCSDNASTCAQESLSCVASFINSTVGGVSNLYQNNFCSALNCTENATREVDFTVRVFDDQRFHFASQCCQGKACNDTSHDSGTQQKDTTECISCYSHNKTVCQEKTQLCYKGEQCVHITVGFANGADEVELRGCSNISNATCQFLSPENTTVGEFIFKKVECMKATTPPGSVISSSANLPIKISFASSVLGTLLLLKLLL